MSLTVIVPSRTFSNLNVCLPRIDSLNPEAHLIVVDDGVTWPNGFGAWDLPRGNIFRERRAPIGWFSGDKPFNFARNVNLGISEAYDCVFHAGDLVRSSKPNDVVLCNDDAILETPGGFTAMQQFCYEHPEYGLLSARVKGNAHHIHAHKEGLTGISEGGLDVPFVCVYIPRKVLDKVGPLDERFTGSIDGEMVYAGEDTDYCMRIRHAGYKLGVFNECVVDHGTLPSTFRGLNGSLPINATMKRFQEIHGFPMWSR